MVLQTVRIFTVSQNMLNSRAVGTLHRLNAVDKVQGRYICPKYQICVGANAQSYLRYAFFLWRTI